MIIFFSTAQKKKKGCGLHRFTCKLFVAIVKIHSLPSKKYDKIFARTKKTEFFPQVQLEVDIHTLGPQFIYSARTHTDAAFTQSRVGNRGEWGAPLYLLTRPDLRVKKENVCVCVCAQSSCPPFV